MTTHETTTATPRWLDLDAIRVARTALPHRVRDRPTDGARRRGRSPHHPRRTRRYRVNPTAQSCTCPDFEDRNEPCKHVSTRCCRS
jgi:hypothetical protein